MNARCAWGDRRTDPPDSLRPGHRTADTLRRVPSGRSPEPYRSYGGPKTLLKLLIGTVSRPTKALAATSAAAHSPSLGPRAASGRPPEAGGGFGVPQPGLDPVEGACYPGPRPAREPKESFPWCRWAYNSTDRSVSGR